MSPLLPLRAAAQALGVSVGTLRKDVERRGLRPVIPGGRGRGRAARFDLEQIRALRSGHDKNPPLADPLKSVTRRAARLPTLIAEAAWSVFMRSHADKRLAGALAAVAYQAAEDVVDELCDVLPSLQREVDLPEKISRLRAIAGTFSKR